MLPPNLLGSLRDLVKNDPANLLEADFAQAREDQVRQTPSVVIVSGGKRQLIAPVPSYPLLKMYLDSRLMR